LIGLYERIAFSAYFLWLSVLAVACGAGDRSLTWGPDLASVRCRPTPSSLNPPSY